MRSLLSRLAREVKVVRVSGIVSGFRGCGLRRSPGSAELRRAAFPPQQVLGGLYVQPAPVRTVAHAEFFPPYSRAAATVFHRLPGTESAVNMAERCASRLGRDITLLRVNNLVERPKWRAPRKKAKRFM